MSVCHGLNVTCRHAPEMAGPDLNCVRPKDPAYRITRDGDKVGWVET